MEINKIAVIGVGAVGANFLYTAINQKLAKNYLVLDSNINFAKGHVLDLSDTIPVFSDSVDSIKYGTYKDLKDVDIIVITAGRPQRPGETRLDMVKDNAKIIKEIAIKVKESDFKGISIIAANPVDIMTTVYQRESNFSVDRVLGSGTILDTLRLKQILSEKLQVNSKAIDVFVMGEHGDSSFIPWSILTINKKPVINYLSQNELDDIENQVRKRAYEIINLKGATYYGIAAGLARLVMQIKNDSNLPTIAGAYLKNGYNNESFYIGMPVVVNHLGLKEIISFSLVKEEQEKFNNSCKILYNILKEIN